MFADGLVAMLADGSWMLNRGMLDGGFAVGVTHLPYKVSRSTMGTIDAYAIFRGTKHPKEALAWLWYVTSPEANRLRAKYQGLQPARRSAALEWPELMRAAEPGLKNVALEVFVQAMACGEPEPIFADQSLLTDLLAPALYRIIEKGDVDAETELKRVTEEINAPMAR